MTETAERMTRADPAWLRRPAVRQHALCRRIEQRLLRYLRLRGKVVVDLPGAIRQEVEDFDLLRHALCAMLPRRRGQSGRQALPAGGGELVMPPLDPAHALGQFHRVGHHEGGSAILVRIHRCIGDGSSLTPAVLSITGACVAQAALMYSPAKRCRCSCAAMSR